MAWVATENFDSYSIGANLNTQNGGSGWTAAWAVTSGTITTETAPAGGQGGLAARNNVQATTRYSRTFTGVSTGIVSWRMRLSVNSFTSNDIGFRLAKTTIGDWRCAVQFGATGNIEIWNNDVAGFQTIQAYSANTWYTGEIELNSVSQANKYRARIDGGTWTDWKTVLGGTLTDVDMVALEDQATGDPHEMWWDDIKPGTVEAGATLMGAICM